MNNLESVNAEAVLILLRKFGVKSAELMNREIIRVEFFPDAANDDIEKKPREDEKVNEATGLTPSRSQDMFLMDE